MNFEFQINNAPQQNNDSAPRKEIDWNARAKYIVDTVGTQNEAEQVVGIISGLVSLGLQDLEDAEMLWLGDAESEVKELERNPNQWFADSVDDKGNKIRVKKWKSKPCQQIAFTVDFPQYQLNQSKYFGEDDGKHHPLRLLLNREFGMQGVGKVVSKPYNIKEVRNDDGSWSFKNNTQIFKLAAATDCLNEQGRFKPQDLPKLIGKAALFEVRVWEKESKGKMYLTEDIKLSGKVPKAMQSMIPQLDQSYLYCVNFDGEQNEEVLKNLRGSIINTMSFANNFKGSSLEAALIKIGKIKASDNTPNNQPEQPINQAPSVKQESKSQVQPTPQGPSVDDFSDDLPFAPIGLQEGRLFLHMI